VSRARCAQASSAKAQKLSFGRGINRQKRAQISHVLSMLKGLLPEAKMQILISQVDKHDRCRVQGYKLFAMSIFYQSRKAYKLLQKLFVLPFQRTLQRSLQKCNVYRGFNTRIMETLAVKAKHMTGLEKDCVLVFDEMALKTKLVYNKERDCVEGFEDFRFIALVFMLRGISSKWKQPLGYFLVSGSVKPTVLARLVDSCLSKLEKIGLFPIVLLCDQGSTNRSYLETLSGVAVDKPSVIKILKCSLCTILPI